MVQVEETNSLGIHCGGKTCPVLALVLSGLGLGVSLGYTLVARIYIRGYYSSAHVAGLVAFITAFVIAHHGMRLRRLLGCGPRPYIALQCVLNVWSLLCCLLVAIGYTLLSVTPAHPSLDHVAAATWGWAGMLLMLYLTAVTIAATRGHWYSSYDLATTRTSFVYHSAQDLPMKEFSLKEFENATNSKTSLVTSSPKPSGCSKCCKGCLRIIFGLLYALFQLLFAIVIFLSAFHPCAVLDDWRLYRTPEDMYTVKVGDHRLQSLYLQCRGSGNETIVYEHDLGAMSYMDVDFLPRMLQEDFRICVHDRRSYGWSQGLENDFLPFVKKDPQWAETSTEFFRALVKEAGITAPFYYVGHGYGGHHIAYTSALYPDLIKGLIFLDSSHLSENKNQGIITEIVANFLPTGLLRIMLACGFDMSYILEQDVSFDEMSHDAQQRLTAVVQSGDYFTATLREHKFLFQDIPEPFHVNGDSLELYPEIQLWRLLNRSLPVTSEVLVVDAGSKSDWVLGQRLGRYNESFHTHVPRASHSELVHSTLYANQTAQIIRAFIQLTESKLSLSQFETIKASIEMS